MAEPLEYDPTNRQCMECSEEMQMECILEDRSPEGCPRKGGWHG